MYCDTEKRWLVGLSTCRLKTLKPGPKQLPLHCGQLAAGKGRRCETWTEFAGAMLSSKLTDCPRLPVRRHVAHLRCCDQLAPNPNCSAPKTSRLDMAQTFLRRSTAV